MSLFFETDEKKSNEVLKKVFVKLIIYLEMGTGYTVRPTYKEALKNIRKLG